jgi:hypothetical protein
MKYQFFLNNINVMISNIKVPTFSDLGLLTFLSGSLSTMSATKERAKNPTIIPAIPKILLI